jgi:hypothetical protein
MPAGSGWPGRSFAEPSGPGGQVCHGNFEPAHGRSHTVGPGRPGTGKGHDKGAQISSRAVRERIGPFDGDENSLPPLPRHACKDLISAVPHCCACCTPAPPNPFTWVSLPPPLPSRVCSHCLQVSPQFYYEERHSSYSITLWQHKRFILHLKAPRFDLHRPPPLPFSLPS